MEIERVKMKICLVGNQSVGKTSLIRRYVFDEFDDRYITTLGTKVTKKKLDMVLEEQDLRLDIDMIIWDIMGQIGFRKLLKEAYFYGASGALAVADCTIKDSLHGLNDWLDGVYTVTNKIPIVVMANKVDLTDRIVIEERDVKKIAETYKSPYYFTSAKTGENVENSFKDIARIVIEKQLKSHVVSSLV